MAINQNANGRADNTRAVTGSQGTLLQQDPNTDKVSTTAVNRGEGNIVISGHDLVDDGDFVIPDDTSLSEAPFIGGGTETVLGVESTSSNAFEVIIDYGEVDSGGNFTSRFTYDQNKNGSLTGDTFYIIRISTVLDRVKITLSDTSGASDNNIEGGFNAH